MPPFILTDELENAPKEGVGGGAAHESENAHRIAFHDDEHANGFLAPVGLRKHAVDDGLHVGSMGASRFLSAR